jgi:hypothetical protein
MRSMLGMLRKWLIDLAVAYPLGMLASCSTYGLVDFVTRPRDLVAKIQPGMEPADVEAIVGRPPESTYGIGCAPDCGPFGHTWTINGHQVQVIFEQDGRVRDVFTYPYREPTAIGRFIDLVFFWWVPNFD